jgi:predicted phosphodiesterase
MKKLLILILATLCMVSAGKSADKTNKWQGNFMFFQMADTQLGAGDYEFNLKEFERAVDYANKKNPDFVVICGDLLSDPFKDKEKEGFKKVAAKLKKSISLHLIAGNHDVGNEPTREKMDWYHKYFGKDYYSFEHKGCVCLVLNSSLIKAPKHMPEEQVKQKKWMLETLKKAKEDKVNHIFIFQHHPYFHQTLNEKVKRPYFCMADQKIEYFKIFQEHNVRAVFAGHYHRNVLGKDGDIEMITTGRIGGKSASNHDSGFRVVHVFEDKIQHVYFGMNDLPEKMEVGVRPENGWDIFGEKKKKKK